MGNKHSEILLGHGSGGLLTHSLIKELFYSFFDNKVLNQGTDSAIIDIHSSKLAFTTDSYVVRPLFFPGGNIGRLAVAGTVNDLAVSGAVPLYISVGMIIEEGFPMLELEQIVSSMAETAKEAGVKIVTGDTKVVEKGKCDRLFINTSGVGMLNDRASNIALAKDVKAGDKIIINGGIGEHGIAILCARQVLSLSSDVVSDVAPLSKLIVDLLDSFSTVKFMRDPTRGGVATTLVEFAQAAGVGVALEEECVPVSKGVRGACEMLGFDPLYIANEGKVIIVVAEQDADAVVEHLRSKKDGKKASVIGTVTTEHPGKVVLKTQIGGRRLVEMLTGDQLPRIC